MTLCNYQYCEKKVLCKGMCANHYRSNWKKEHNYKTIDRMREVRFGGLRMSVLERDDFMCVLCGMSNLAHLDRWGVELSIDHIDGLGRYARNPNNEMTNLRTLCMSCHGREDKNKSMTREDVMR